MPRTARLDAPCVFHYVMIRGIERRNIFRNKKDREDLVGGGLVRSLGGWSEVKRMGGAPAMSDERILGESDFVDKILSEAGEALDRRYELKALGYDLQRVAERAAAVLGMEVADIFSPGRQDGKVKARSLVCFWVARELGMSLTDLARAFAMSIPGISYTVTKEKTWPGAKTLL